MNLQMNGNAADVSDSLLAFQTQGPGREHFKCYSGSLQIDCPALGGTWRDSKIDVIREYGDIEWRLTNEPALRAAVEAKFNVMWDLLIVKPVETKYMDTSSCDFDTIRGNSKNCATKIISSFNGLRLYDSALNVNVFSGHAVKLYDDAMTKGLNGKIISFMKSNLALFNCGDCDLTTDLQFTAKSPAEVIAKAAKDLQIPEEFWTFSELMVPHRECPDVVVGGVNRCRSEPLNWRGAINLKPGYPPKMEESIQKFIQEQRQIVDSMRQTCKVEQLTEQVEFQYQSAIFSLGAAQDFVGNVLNYEKTVKDLIDAEEERKRSIIEFIVTFIITEIIVTVVTAGIGTIATAIAAAAANSARFAAFGARLGQTGAKIGNLMKSIGQLKSVRSIRNVLAEFKTMMKFATEPIKKLGQKVKVLAGKAKVCIKCSAPHLFEMGVDQLVSEIMEKRSPNEFGYLDHESSGECRRLNRRRQQLNQEFQ
jgi:uncharacterized membrane protein required for colicin V production